MQTMKNGAGEPQLEEESSSFAEGAVRCGFKDDCFIVSGEEPQGNEGLGNWAHSTINEEKVGIHM